MHLWEAEHPYYASEGNYFENGLHYTYKSWSDFLAEWEDADMDMNHIYRWDWSEGEDAGAGAYMGDDNYRNGVLKLFYIGQRKAICLSCEAAVCRADEPAVLAFLKLRYEHLLTMWTPLSNTENLNVQLWQNNG